MDKSKKVHIIILEIKYLTLKLYNLHKKNDTSHIITFVNEWIRLYNCKPQH